MSNANRGQVGSNAAEVYESFFVRALFQQFAEPMCEAARIGAGQIVLDVACGTGVLARVAARRVGATGAVVGADINESMLAVARRSNPGITWKNCPAEALAFGDRSFDAVTCQFGLMFFTDRPKAVREMARVLRPGGRLAIAVWDRLSATPGYDAMTNLLQRLFGDAAADALRAPFSLGDLPALLPLFADAGLDDVQAATQEGTARFDSIDAWVDVNIRGWTLADMIDDTQYARLLDASRTEFRGMAEADGSVAFRAPAHIVSASKS
jgi:SAM-dependent methyltransferase